jgi:dihydropteroate synthase
MPRVAGVAGPSEPDGLPAGLRGLGRCLVMGVLNVTPDSFSDGGLFLDEAAAVKRGRWLHENGADLVDVGGESTRPGARRISVAEELSRVLSVVRALAAAGVPVSIDTMRAEVAAAALGAGAVVINDVSSGQADPEMLPFAATVACPYIAMHWRGHSAVMATLTAYADVVADVRAELAARLDAAERAGVDAGRVVLDPGLGFAKTAEHNWVLLARLDELASLGRPLLVGASRKRFLGALLAAADGTEPGPGERDGATAAISALAAAAGTWCVRVHDSAPSRDAILVASAWRAAGGSGSGGPDA